MVKISAEAPANYKMHTTGNTSEAGLIHFPSFIQELHAKTNQVIYMNDSI
jgi:hypothetical protein